jgi:hypothetical protein
MGIEWEVCGLNLVHYGFSINFKIGSIIGVVGFLFYRARSLSPFPPPFLFPTSPPYVYMILAMSGLGCFVGFVLSSRKSFITDSDLEVCSVGSFHVFLPACLLFISHWKM